MNQDFLWSFVGTVAGLMTVWMGLYAYVGKGAPEFYRRAYRNSFGLFGPAIIVFLLPCGLGMLLMSSAFMIGKNEITTNVLVAGFGFFVVAWILFFIHPRWVLPRWLRSPRALQ